jgi:uncharacterized protein DUF4397
MLFRHGMFAALTLVAACGTKDAAGPLVASGSTGRIRFVNVITDTTRGRVNAILENVPFGVNLTYTQSTPATLPSPSTALYSAILSGSRSLVLKRTADTNATVAVIPITIDANQDRTVYAVGGAGSSTVTSFVTTDTNTAVPSAGTRLRIVNLSPTAAAVDVFITAAAADLSAATPVASNLKNQSASAYFTLAPGTYSVRTVPAGTAPAARGAAVSITLNGLALAGGAARTIVLADNNVGGAPLRAFVLTDQ